MAKSAKGICKLKNVTLYRIRTRGGDTTWLLIHNGGWRDPYFDYFAKNLLEHKGNKFNTREQYCRLVASFIDYLLEAAKWFCEVGYGSLTAKYRQVDLVCPDLDISGLALVEFINIYPKVLAGGKFSEDPIVVALAERLGRSVYSQQSQRIHIAAVNNYLALSESFQIRMQQSGVKEINGLPLLTDSTLFPHIGSAVELSRFERMALSAKSMIGGVIAGGPKLKRLAALKPAVAEDNGEWKFDYDSAFPLESAPELINHGFNTYRDRALYCLLMASGIRISEALVLTWSDLDFKNRKIYIRNPRTKDLDKVYFGCLTLEQRSNLPHKGRTHPVTVLVEPFASEFWRLLKAYMNKEMFITSAHPFVFQVLQGVNKSEPLIFSDQSNLRKAFKAACHKIGVDEYGAHSLRHMYGVYAMNYWPNTDGTYGLPPDLVQFLLGHSNRNSTMHYAKPDTLVLEVEQKINAAIMSGFTVEDSSEIRVRVLEKTLQEARADASKMRLLKGEKEDCIISTTPTM